MISVDVFSAERSRKLKCLPGLWSHCFLSLQYLLASILLLVAADTLLERICDTERMCVSVCVNVCVCARMRVRVWNTSFKNGLSALALMALKDHLWPISSDISESKEVILNTLELCLIYQTPLDKRKQMQLMTSNTLSCPSSLCAKIAILLDTQSVTGITGWHTLLCFQYTQCFFSF